MHEPFLLSGQSQFLSDWIVTGTGSYCFEGIACRIVLGKYGELMLLIESWHILYVLVPARYAFGWLWYTVLLSIVQLATNCWKYWWVSCCSVVLSSVSSRIEVTPFSIGPALNKNIWKLLKLVRYYGKFAVKDWFDIDGLEWFRIGDDWKFIYAIVHL